jgi:hypothetical protein
MAIIYEQLVIVVVDRLPHLIGLGGFQDNAMGMEDTDTKQVAVLPHHLQDYLGVLGVSDPHGVVDASLNGLQKKVGALSGGIYELNLFPAQVQECIDADTKDQKAYGDDNDSVCQAFENQPASWASKWSESFGLYPGMGYSLKLQDTR